MVDGTAKRFPAKSGICAVKIGEEIGRNKGRAYARTVVTASVRNTEVEVGGFAQVAVGANVADNADVLAAAGVEHVGRITAQNLSGALEKPVLRGGQKA